MRVDTWVETGTEVSPHYDSLLAKLMVWAPTREEAVAKMAEALEATALQVWRADGRALLNCWWLLNRSLLQLTQECVHVAKVCLHQTHPT